MRKIIFSIATAAVLVGTSACTITVEDRTKSEPEASATPSESVLPESGGMTDEEYAGFLREEAPELVGVSTKDIMDATEAVCYALSQGASLEDLVSVGMPSGLQAETVGAVVGGAVAYECPEYSYMFSSSTT